MSEPRRGYAEHQRARLSAAAGAAPHPARCDPRGMRPDRHAYGLRAWRVRRLHGVARRRAGPRLPDVRGAGRGRAIRTVEGLARRRCAASGAAAFIAHHGVQCGFCTPGFLMLAIGVLEREPDIADDELRRDAVVQSVPLHRLPEHRRGGARGDRGIARRSRHEHRARRIRGASSRPLGAAAGGSAAASPGEGQFVGDIAFPHQLHMRVVRSPYAHALLRGVDIAAALAAPGVRRGVDRGRYRRSAADRFSRPGSEALRPYRQPLLARDRLRYVGEPVAAVFATDAYLAEDAADLVAIEAEELPPVLDAAGAARQLRARAFRPRRWCCAKAMATSMPRSPRRMRSSRST